MKKLLVLIVFCVCAIQMAAQDRVEFLGMQLSKNTKSAFAEKLKEKGFKYETTIKGKDADSYSGKFFGFDSVVLIVPTDDKKGIYSIVVKVAKTDPDNGGTLIAKLTSIFKNKYPDYEFEDEERPDGSFAIYFMSPHRGDFFDSITITPECESDGLCKILIYFISDLNSSSSTQDGIGMDDL